MSADSAETMTNGKAAPLASEPTRVITAPGTGRTSSAPTTATRRPTAREGTVVRFAVVVVVCGALPQPVAAPAHSTDSAMRAALIRIPSKSSWGGPRRPAPCESNLPIRLLDGGGNALHLAGLQQRELRGDCRLDGCRHLRAPLAVAHAVHRRAEHDVRAGLQLAALRRHDRGMHGDVDLLQGARHDPRAEVTLVRVDADPEDVLRVRRVEHTEATLAGDLELDNRALCDL